MSEPKLESLTWQEWIPLRCTHQFLPLDDMKMPETLDQLLRQKTLLQEAVVRYFEWTWFFSELKSGDEAIAEMRKNAKILCLQYNSRNDIEWKKDSLTHTYWEEVVKLVLEHYEASWAWDLALLRWAVEMELEAEKAEMEQEDAALIAQIEAWKGTVSKTL